MYLYAFECCPYIVLCNTPFTYNAFYFLSLNFVKNDLNLLEKIKIKIISLTDKPLSLV